MCRTFCGNSENVQQTLLITSSVEAEGVSYSYIVLWKIRLLRVLKALGRKGWVGVRMSYLTICSRRRKGIHHSLKSPKPPAKDPKLKIEKKHQNFSNRLPMDFQLVY